MASSSASLTILSTHTTDLSPSLLLTTPTKRYLFNIPEALSRVAVQSKIPLKRVGNIFVGDLEQTIGGLPGGILSIVEGGGREIMVSGEEGLEHAVASYRFFTRREQLSLSINEVIPPSTSTTDSLPTPIFEDEILSVYAFSLLSSTPTVSLDSVPPNHKRRRSLSPDRYEKHSSTTSTSLPPPSFAHGLPFDSTTPTFDPTLLLPPQATLWRKAIISDMFRASLSLPRNLKSSTPSYLLLGLPPFQKSREENISFLGIGKRTRGEFLKSVAVERGVREGPKFARLVRGERVWVSKRVFVPPSSLIDSTLVGGETESNGVGKGKGKGKIRSKELTEEQKKGSERAAKRLLITAEKAFEDSIVDGEGEGYWVEAAECLGAGKEGEGFLVLNLKSVDYLDSLLTTLPTKLLELKSVNLKTIYYFLGPAVLTDPRLLTWISTFSTTSTISHQFSSTDLIPQNNPVVFAPAALLSLRLQQLSPMFHLPHYTFLPPSSAADLNLLPPGFPTNSRISRANDTTSFGVTTSSLASLPKTKKLNRKNPTAPPLINITPAAPRNFNFLVPSLEADIAASQLKPLEKPSEVHLAAQKIYQSYLVATKVAKLAILAEEELSGKEGGEREVGDDIVVTPLGTGSAIPSKYRNVSGTLLHLPPSSSSSSTSSSTSNEKEGDDYVLLDVGEGTWGQLVRRFGSTGGKSILKGLKMIFISHMHQDHHAGLIRLLRERYLVREEMVDRLTIIAPQGVPLYLKEQANLFNLGLDQINFIQNYNLEADRSLYGHYLQNMEELKGLLGMKSIITVPVLHRCRCWGLVLTHSSGYKIVFSGDTMPCEALVKAGSNATLLIHEATIESELPEVAAEKGHSTFAQAIDIATRMKAKHCLLTHFSARYPKLPPLSPSPSPPSPSPSLNSSGELIEISTPIIGIAFDLMSLRVDEFWKMAKFREAMEVLFSEIEVEKEGDGGDRMEE